MAELKPCPICKSKATITHTGDGYIPHCTYSMCVLSNFLMKPRATEDEASTAWNRRIKDDIVANDDRRNQC